MSTSSLALSSDSVALATGPEPMTILVADDDSVTRSILQTALGLLSPGPRFVVAEDGAQAIRSIHDEQIDLVITDIQMPGANGLQVLAQAASRENPVPVIAVTGSPTAELRAKVADGGASLLLEKPIDPRHLVDQVNHLLADRLRGHLEGFTLAGFLQFIEMERKSCQLTVADEVFGTGMLWFIEGRLAHAETSTEQGEAAALDILSLAMPQVTILDSVYPHATTISRSLTQLLLEGAQADDESSQAVFDDLQFLVEQAQDDQDALSGAAYATLLADLASASGFLEASIIDLSRRRVVCTYDEVESGDSALHRPGVLDSVCRMIEAEKAIAAFDAAPSKNSSIVLRQQDHWHFIHSITENQILHVLLERQANVALLQHKTDRWLAEDTPR